MNSGYSQDTSDHRRQVPDKQSGIYADQRSSRADIDSLDSKNHVNNGKSLETQPQLGGGPIERDQSPQGLNLISGLIECRPVFVSIAKVALNTPYFGIIIIIYLFRTKIGNHSVHIREINYYSAFLPIGDRFYSQ